MQWLPDVEEHDCPAAESYHSLTSSGRRVTKIVSELRAARLVLFKAKDTFRASRLSVLGVGNSHVEKDRKKIRNGQGVSPLLLVRDRRNGKAVIANGYHRLCALYEINEDAVVLCQDRLASVCTRPQSKTRIAAGA